MSRLLTTTSVVFCLAVSHMVTAATAGADSAATQQAVTKGIEYLRKGQAQDGSFTAQVGPGITALATSAALRSGLTVDDPLVAKGLKYLESCVRPDGSITAPRPRTTNYDTSICVVCFALANTDGRYDKIIAHADKFLKGAQHGASDGSKPMDTDYGGIGYTAKSSGADLSNTHMMLDALQAAGSGPDDPAVQRAIVFVSRCQNLEGPNNTLKFASQVNDGGFYYSPVGDGSSAAGKAEEGALRSYGSMTYAGLKSMLYAGVTADDPRVKAALTWLRKNYSVEENPGLGTSGLFYYYHLMAKALDAAKLAKFEDSTGKLHDWQTELAAALIEQQNADGSWTNSNERWLESDPSLATSFALLALAYCQEPQK